MESPKRTKTTESRFRDAVLDLFGSVPEYDWSLLESEVELIFSKEKSDKEYEGGYWYQAGVYQNLQKYLLKQMPGMGASKYPKLNLLHDVTAISYDVYNNGWCNERDFLYTDRIKGEPKKVAMIRRSIEEYEKEKNNRYDEDDEDEDDEDEDNDEDEEEEDEDQPFEELDLEYAINAAVRFCIGGEELDDAILYPNLSTPKDDE
jgi:hypothetical protein